MFKMIQIAHYDIETGMGSLSKSSRDRLGIILSESELNELDSIGYSGKTTQGDRISYEYYLNSLDKGSWTVHQTKFDNGDFSQAYNFTRAFHP